MRIASALVALLIAAIAAGCEDGPTPPAAGTPTVEATPGAVSTATAPPAAASTPTATPTPTPTPSPPPSPTPTATLTPSPTPIAIPSPSPTATPSPTPTATPEATPTSTPTPLLTAADLGIREVDVTEVLAGAGLTHVRYAAGEEVPWDPGLFLLDVESGAVEGWVYSLSSLSAEQPVRFCLVDALTVSPGSRFVQWDDDSCTDYVQADDTVALYDRQTARMYTWDGYNVHGHRAFRFERWWGSGDSERLLFWVSSLDAYVMLDGDLQPVVQFETPPGEHFSNPTGGYILVREYESSTAFHLVNFADETNPELHTWVLPWEPLSDREGGSWYRIELLDNLVAFVGGSDSACHVTRYDLGGVLLSDRIIPCGSGWRWSESVSPDGRLIAIPTFSGSVASGYGPQPAGMVLSIFDAVTGAEVMRLLGVHPSWIGSEFDTRGEVWLADSSGIIVDTSYGRWVAGLDGAWRPAPGWASPDDPDLFFDHRRWTPRSNFVAINSEGVEQASLSFGPTSAAIPNPHGGALILRERPGWGARSDTVRVWTSYFHVFHGDDYYPLPPPLRPVIEGPPFEDRVVEVVVGTCLNLRQDASHDAPILTCLAHGTTAETDDFWREWSSDGPSSWMHIRTEDGVEGWAHADYLRWHSDGVRLEE